MNAVSFDLNDKYLAESGRIYLTGTQALVRLTIEQAKRDRKAGLNTAGFVSGYRGSPVAGVDQQMWSARSILESHSVSFKPALNEDLAATAVWGTQQVGLWPGAKVDGVFGMWYGKGPGVDRTGDVFRHANHYGTSPHGGVLAVAGDDHSCKTTTVAAQCDYGFMGHSMPVVVPGNVSEIIEFGLKGWAMSRFSGLWVAFKVLADVIDTSSSLSSDFGSLEIVQPDYLGLPPDGINIRNDEQYAKLDERVQKHRIPAALAFARRNGFDKLLADPPSATVGILSYGKTAFDAMQALLDLGYDRAALEKRGVRVLKLGLTWPLAEETILEFAEGLQEIVIVEDRAPVIERQVKAILFNRQVRPGVTGKRDMEGRELFKEWSDLSISEITTGLARRLSILLDSDSLRSRLRFLADHGSVVTAEANPVVRKPYYCSGCPHNTSTKVIEGSRAIGGVGCHYISTWIPDRRTDVFTQMGGEGVVWIGQQPYREEDHVFANLGDGTYFHSGILAVRAAVASGVNITYKLLFNGVVAMTGGQPFDGTLSVPQLCAQLSAEGVRRLTVVAEDPSQYEDVDLGGVAVRGRDKLSAVEEEFRSIAGTTVIIYDQTCATEKRRRRKRGLMPKPARRVFINDRVCEGCGDCSTESNCVSVLPLDTAFGRKREIDQSNCNSDLSCVQGFCPSFVFVEGVDAAPARQPWPPSDDLPEAAIPTSLTRPFGIVMTGIGGTGVVTIGAILGVAAHFEGKAVTVLDSLGFSQKGGGVSTQIKIYNSYEEMPSLKISDGAADVLLAFDNLLGANLEILRRLSGERTRAAVNSYDQVTPQFISDPDFRNPSESIMRSLGMVIGDGSILSVDANRTCRRFLGDAIAANMMLLGFAWQNGLIPLGVASIMRAIEANGTSVELNKKAFELGRTAAHDPARLAAEERAEAPHQSETLDETIERLSAELVLYQNDAYAARYRSLVETVRGAENAVMPGRSDLARAVALNAFKLMAYKDEYEVARLYSAPDFLHKVHRELGKAGRMSLSLAPPLLSRIDPRSGRPIKREFGPWIFAAMRYLANLKVLRGTFFDPFGHTHERRIERALFAGYESRFVAISRSLTVEQHGAAVALARLPERIKGFGPVKSRSLSIVSEMEAPLLEYFPEIRVPETPIRRLDGLHAAT